MYQSYLPKEDVIASFRLLARMGVEPAMPLVLTNTIEEYVRSTIQQLREVTPQALVSLYKRGRQVRQVASAALPTRPSRTEKQRGHYYRAHVLRANS